MVLSSDDKTLQLQLWELDAISPFYLVVGPDNRILSHGRTLCRLVEQDSLVGEEFSSIFRMIKPHATPPNAIATDGTAIKLRTRSGGESAGYSLPGVALRAVLQDGTGLGVLMMLSPGLEIQRMVENLKLHMADLSPADSSTDLLFLVETQVQLLHNAIDNSVRMEEARQEAEWRAESDWLTGIYNRRGLMERLQAHLENREEKGCGLIHIDLDRFKLINDTHGHAAGDALLKHVAEILEKCVDRPRFMGRIGGDEFVVACPFDESMAPARQLAERLECALRTAIDWNGVQLEVHATFGVAFAGPQQDIDSDELLHQADVAMLEGKRLGRGGVHAFSSALAQDGFDLRVLADEVAPGRAAGQFHPLFEGLFDTGSGALRTLEIMESWAHPVHGHLLLEQFQAAAELGGASFDIVGDIRADAFAELAELRRSGYELPQISLSLSNEELSAPDTPGRLEWLVYQHGFEAEQVTLEISDQVLERRYSDALVADLAGFADMGFRLSLKGMGSAATPLGTLVRLPIHQFKIDKRFTVDLLADSGKQLLVETVIELGKKLNVGVVATCVDSAAIRAWLFGAGCDLVQGPAVAPRVPARGLSDLLVMSEAARAL